MNNEEDEDNESMSDMSQQQKQLEQEMQKRFLPNSLKSNLIIIDSPSQTSFIDEGGKNANNFFNIFVGLYIFLMFLKTVYGLYILESSNQNLREKYIFSFIYICLYTFLWGVVLIIILLIFFVNYHFKLSSQLDESSPSSIYFLLIIIVSLFYFASYPLSIIIVLRCKSIFFHNRHIMIFILINIISSFIFFVLAYLKKQKMNQEKIRQEKLNSKEKTDIKQKKEIELNSFFNKRRETQDPQPISNHFFNSEFILGHQRNMTNISKKNKNHEDTQNSYSDISSFRLENNHQNKIVNQNFNNFDNFIEENEEEEYYNNLRNKILKRIRTQYLKEKGMEEIIKKEDIPKSKSKDDFGLHQLSHLSIN